MQNWRDEIQFPYPGYRDRIVQISQLGDEGGLNLNMPDENIDALNDAGQCAADKLIARFRSPDQASSPGWTNHEEIRLRTFLGLAQELVLNPAIGDPHWDAVIERISDYNMRHKQLARSFLRKLGELKQEARASGCSLTEKAPRPRAGLGITPRI